MASAGEKILIEGNKAAALGSLFGGASVLTWYPITPSSSLAEYAEEFLKKYRVNAEGKKTFAVVQAEDELAAVGMAIGAGWAGARALTATAGPGISLMSEFVGLAYFAEIPVVIIDVQRMGPSTGLPTRTSQGDIQKLHLLGHGDSRHIVLIPGSVEECYSLTMEALDLAQQFQTPVFVATDLDLGMNLWLSDPFPYPTKPLAPANSSTPPTWTAWASSRDTRTSTATASAIARSPAPSTRWRPTSPAAPATTTSRGTASDPRIGRKTSIGSHGSTRPPARPCPRR